MTAEAEAEFEATADELVAAVLVAERTLIRQQLESLRFRSVRPAGEDRYRLMLDRAEVLDVIDRRGR